MLSGDRRIGSAGASYEYLYPAEGYDLTPYMGALSPEECVEIICGIL